LSSLQKYILRCGEVYLTMSDYRAKTAYQNETDASSYDQKRFTSMRGRIGHYLDRRALGKALSQLSDHQVHTLIDIPCGTSRISKDLIKLGYKLFGSDISFEMMENGKNKISHFRSFYGFAQCDASRAAFIDNSFDCLVCVRFIGHIPAEYRDSIFSEFGRISRFSIIELSLESNIAKMRKKIDRLLRSGSDLPSRWKWEVFDTAGLEQELADSGFKIIAKWPKFRFFSDSWFVLLGNKD